MANQVNWTILWWKQGTYWYISMCIHSTWSHRDRRDHMIIGFTTIYAISAYQH